MFGIAQSIWLCYLAGGRSETLWRGGQSHLRLRRRAVPAAAARVLRLRRPHYRNKKRNVSIPPHKRFKTFFMGGFECSTHRRRDGRRLDMIGATGHDRFALQDYTALAQLGIHTVRDGIRWHLIESKPGQYDFSSVRPMLYAARRAGVQVIWDIFHYGWPD